jgi:hypothetical protein
MFVSVCVYKGKQYNQGQKWQDGCAYDCECVDGNMGQFQCTDKYVVNSFQTHEAFKYISLL